MLYDIAVGPFLEQPAGKIAAPLAVGSAADVELDEGAGFLHIFPRRAGFARLEADDRVARAQCIAGLHGEVRGDAIALVEQADHCHPLGHGGAGKRAGYAVADLLPLYADGAGLIRGREIVIAAARQHQRDANERDMGQDRQERPRRAPRHDASGLHAS